MIAVLWLFGLGYIEPKPMPDLATCEKMKPYYVQWAKDFDRRNVRAKCIEAKD